MRVKSESCVQGCAAEQYHWPCIAFMHKSVNGSNEAGRVTSCSKFCEKGPSAYIQI